MQPRQQAQWNFTYRRRESKGLKLTHFYILCLACTGNNTELATAAAYYPPIYLAMQGTSAIHIDVEANLSLLLFFLCLASSVQLGFPPWAGNLCLFSPFRQFPALRASIAQWSIVEHSASRGPTISLRPLMFQFPIGRSFFGIQLLGDS